LIERIRGEQQVLTNGEWAEASFIVQASDSAERLAMSIDDRFPDVFATSRMIALMELAAARAMKKVLRPEQLSVGVSLNVRHSAATPLGSEVRARATYLHQDDKLLVFKVEAFDQSGMIGDGEHTRAVVDTERLLRGAERRRRITG
jgi:fluoroacetyl-CoA thioesterase